MSINWNLYDTGKTVTRAACIALSADQLEDILGLGDRIIKRRSRVERFIWSGGAKCHPSGWLWRSQSFIFALSYKNFVFCADKLSVFKIHKSIEHVCSEGISCECMITSFLRLKQDKFFNVAHILECICRNFGSWLIKVCLFIQSMFEKVFRRISAALWHIWQWVGMIFGLRVSNFLQVVQCSALSLRPIKATDSSVHLRCTEATNFRSNTSYTCLLLFLLYP